MDQSVYLKQAPLFTNFPPYDVHVSTEYSPERRRVNAMFTSYGRVVNKVEMDPCEADEGVKDVTELMRRIHTALTKMATGHVGKFKSGETPVPSKPTPVNIGTLVTVPS